MTESTSFNGTGRLSTSSTTVDSDRMPAKEAQLSTVEDDSPMSAFEVAADLLCSARDNPRAPYSLWGHHASVRDDAMTAGWCSAFRKFRLAVPAFCIHSLVAD